MNKIRIEEVLKRLSGGGEFDSSVIESTETEYRERDRKLREDLRKRKEEEKRIEAEKKRQEQADFEFALREQERLNNEEAIRHTEKRGYGRGWTRGEVMRAKDQPAFRRERYVKKQLEEYQGEHKYSNNASVQYWHGDQLVSRFDDQPPQDEFCVNNIDQYEDLQSGIEQLDIQSNHSSAFDDHQGSSSSFHSAGSSLSSSPTFQAHRSSPTVQECSPTQQAACPSPTKLSPSKPPKSRIAARFPNMPPTSENPLQHKAASGAQEQISTFSFLTPNTHPARTGSTSASQNGISINSLNASLRVFNPNFLTYSNSGRNEFVLKKDEFPPL